MCFLKVKKKIGANNTAAHVTLLRKTLSQYK